ncbi:unnamed protein product [Leptidea sinapis]|uniref:Uncharacterized protein n=1 Tax=Leptidea sinapis TaxID=189913 RepID=A0A5E4R0Y3_9NEOP|nr:unnamed protein product [Leptidea sinapis]
MWLTVCGPGPGHPVVPGAGGRPAEGGARAGRAAAAGQLSPAPPGAGARRPAAAGRPAQARLSDRTAMASCAEPVFAGAGLAAGSGAGSRGGATYEPVQPLAHDHGVTVPPLHSLDRHLLQIMQHGTSCVVGEAEWGGSLVHLRLERGCALLSWTRTAHRPHAHTGETPSENVPQPEINLSYNPEEVIPLKYSGNLAFDGEAGVVGDEGFIDLQCVKDVRLGGLLLEPRELAEQLAGARRHGLAPSTPRPLITLVYGATLSDNRALHLLMPLYCHRVWAVGLYSVVKALMQQARLADRSLLWLKNKYTALYYEDGCCCEPLVSDAIRIFGGRDSIFNNSTHSTPSKAGEPGSETGRGASSRFRKNRASWELRGSPRSHSSHSSGRTDDDAVHPSPRHSSYSAVTASPHSSLGPRHSSLTATSLAGSSPNRSRLLPPPKCPATAASLPPASRAGLSTGAGQNASPPDLPSP